MLEAYKNLWCRRPGFEELEPPVLVLLFLSITVPLFLILGLFEPDLALIPLAICGGLAVAVLVFDTTKFLFWLFPVAYFINHYKINNILLVLIVISHILRMLQTGKVQLDIPFPTLFLFLLAAMANGVLNALDPVIGRYTLIVVYLLPLALFFITFNLSPTIHEIKTHLAILSFIAGVTGWISLAIYLGSGSERVVFHWESQNVGASFLGMVFPITLISLIDARTSRDKAFWAFALIGTTAGIISSQTRAVLFSCLIAVLYLALQDKKAMKVFLPILIAALILTPTLLISRFAMMFGRADVADWSSIGRIEIWYNSLKMLPTYLWSGMGCGSYKIIYATRFPDSLILAPHPHNIYLHLIFEWGIVGMLAFYAIVLNCLIRGHRATKSVVIQPGSPARTLFAINAAVILLLVAGLMDSYIKDTMIESLLWMYLAYQLILSRRLRGPSSLNSESSALFLSSNMRA